MMNYFKRALAYYTKKQVIIYTATAIVAAVFLSYLMIFRNADARIFRSQGTIIKGKIINLTSVTSEPVLIDSSAGYAVHTVIECLTCTGTTTIDISNDGQNWINLPDSTDTILGPVNNLVNANGVYYNFMRVTVSSTNAEDMRVTTFYSNKRGI
jgi:hypothetical protein